METLTTNAASLLNIHLTPDQVQAFIKYETALMDWNARINLTAIRDAESIRLKHFLDSLTLMLAADPAQPVRSLIDVGTGAGFPGIPLKILMPDLHLTLVESVHKKADFCAHVVDLLGLKHVEIVAERAEDLGRMKPHRQKYDWAVARAVAQMPALMELLLPLVRVGGLAIAQKGGTAPAETTAAEFAIRTLGGRLKKLLPITLPGIDEPRYLVLVEKVAVTPPAYPRSNGIPTKKPLV